MSSRPPISWKNSSEYWVGGELTTGEGQRRNQALRLQGREEDPSRVMCPTSSCVCPRQVQPFFSAATPTGCSDSLPQPGQFKARFFPSSVLTSSLR